MIQLLIVLNQCATNPTTLSESNNQLILKFRKTASCRNFIDICPTFSSIRRKHAKLPFLSLFLLNMNLYKMVCVVAI